MFAIVSALLRYLLSWLRPKHELALANLAFRHQIAVLNRRAHKPRLQGKDRLFWVVLKRWWPNWRVALIIFQPETVLGWQRAGFRMCPRPKRFLASISVMGCLSRYQLSAPVSRLLLFIGGFHHPPG